jgi:hypothetical protein
MTPTTPSPISDQAAGEPHPSIARAIAQEERACRAEDALIDLVNQIRKTNPVDDHGHDLKMNRAYLEAQKLLDSTAPTTGSAPRVESIEDQPIAWGEYDTQIGKDRRLMMASVDKESGCRVRLYDHPERDAAPSEAISDVLAERERQDAQWGGQDHDDQQSNRDWTHYMGKQAAKIAPDPERARERYIKIAALAVAAIESIDRAAIAPRDKT